MAQFTIIVIRNKVGYLSVRERVLALTVLAMSVSLLPVVVTLCPQTSIDRAPSWQFSINSSVKLILKSFRKKNNMHKNPKLHESLNLLKIHQKSKTYQSCTCQKIHQFIKNIYVLLFFFTSKCIIQMSVCTTLTFLCWNLTITVSPVEFWRSTMSGLIWGGTTTESSWPQNVYWQNTKLDMEEGRPLAERIVNYNEINIVIMYARVRIHLI